MTDIDMIIISMVVIFFMFFIWLCILSIRLSMIYKVIATSYQDMCIEDTQDDKKDEHIVPPLCFEEKEITSSYSIPM